MLAGTGGGLGGEIGEGHNNFICGGNGPVSWGGATAGLCEILGGMEVGIVNIRLIMCNRKEEEYEKIEIIAIT